MDVGYDLYRLKGSNAQAITTYVNNVIAGVAMIYQRDLGVKLKIKDLVIWNKPDPFSGTTTSQQLASYKNYNINNRKGKTRALAHLLDTSRNLAGIAYVGSVCDQNFGYGVSNFDGRSNSNGNVYQWDIYVLAHELGHNFGSPHTHMYKPVVDCCYVEKGSSCSRAVAQVGSIMSYCHMNGKISMNFHPRTTSMIKNDLQRRSCLKKVN